MGKRTEGDCLRELQDYFDQRAKVGGDNPPLWEHASEMCVALLQDMGATDAGPLTSIYTRVIGEMVRHSAGLERALKQSNADEHAALSAVDRLKGELVDTQKSLDASRAKRADLLDELQRLRVACRLADGELEALAEINRDRMSLPASAPRLLLANFVERVRAAIETPNAANASAGPGSPTQRLKAVEQELALVWQVVNAMADEKVGRVSLMASTAIQVRDQARAERGRE